MEQKEQTQNEELQDTIGRCKSRGRIAVRIAIVGLILGPVISLIAFMSGGCASVTEDYGTMWAVVVFLYIGIMILIIGLLSLFTALVIRSRCAFLEKRSQRSKPESIDASVGGG